MKAIATLAAVITAAATVAAAGAPEKSGLAPGAMIITPPTPAVSASGSVAGVKASAPDRAPNAADPRAFVDGPLDIDDGAAVRYELLVSNDGDADLPGPIIVDLEFSPAFASAVILGNGWTCSMAAQTCQWPGTLAAGDFTALAQFDFVAAPPYGDWEICDPERSPCLEMRATVRGHPASASERSTAVTIGGISPPTAVDDFVYMPLVPRPIDIDPLANDQGVTQLSLEIADAPTQGTLTFNGNIITYTPGPGFTGADAFRYRIRDFFNGTDTSVVGIGTLVGGIAFPEPLVDIAQVEVVHVAMVGTFLQNTTGDALEGTISVGPVPPAEVAAVLAGTGYDPSLVAFDPFVFKPVDGQHYSTFGNGAFQFTTFSTRPLAPLGTVWLARFRYDLHPIGSPGAVVSASVDVVARSATAAEAPIHVVPDSATVPPDVPTMLRPLANDDSSAGNVLTVSALYSSDPWSLDPESAVGQLDFADAQGPGGTIPYLGVLYTPPPGYTGTNAFYYAASEIVNSTLRRYDFAKFTLTVAALPPPPVAVASGSATICAGGSAPLAGSGGVSCTWTPATGLSDPASCTPTASPTATTTYSLVVTDAFGQLSTNAATVTVTVEPIPVATASGSTSIPPGGSAPLSGAGGASCTWSPAAGLNDPTSCAPIASPSSTTIYSLVVTSAAGCVSTNPASATITVLPAGGADLIVASVVVTNQARPGDVVTPRVVTSNVGAGASSPFSTRVYLSADAVPDAGDMVVANILIDPGLPAGQATIPVPVPFIVPVLPAGQYYVIGAADIFQEVPETDETNNTLYARIHIKRDRP